jgi:hypothetical protein
MSDEEAQGLLRRLNLSALFRQSEEELSFVHLSQLFMRQLVRECHEQPQEAPVPQYLGLCLSPKVYEQHLLTNGSWSTVHLQP